MSINTSVDGQTYAVPETGERGWGAEVTNLLVALGDNSLLIKGGSIPLTSDADFGANFGLVSIYYKSRSANISDSGVLRLANTDTVTWRNGANSANLTLAIASDRLQYESSDVVLTDSTDTLTNKTLTSPVLNTQVTGDALETDLASSALSTKLATAAAIKTYVDNVAAGQNDASEINYNNATSGLTATDVQAAIDEVEGRVDTVETDSAANTADIADLRTTTGTSDGDTNMGTFTGSTITDNVSTKTALQELETSLETKVGNAEVATFTNKTIDADNNTISNLAHGAEVDNPTSGVHGVTGNIVGTTDAQVITSKDIDGGTASNTSRITVPKAATGTLSGLTRKEGTIVYDTTEAKLFVDDGTNLNPIGGGLEPTPIDHTDLPLTAEAGKYYLVDISGATADETLTLPNITTESESIGVQVVSASSTYGLVVAADASDTVDSATQFTLRNERDWRVLNAQSASNWASQRPSSGSGAQVGPWAEVTGGDLPTYSWLTLGTGGVRTMHYRRIGDSIEIRESIALGTGGDVTGSMDYALPFGLTIDTAVIDSTTGESVGNCWARNLSGANTYYPGAVRLNTSNTSYVPVFDGDTGSAGVSIPFNWAATDQIGIQVTIPVAEWANSGTTVTLQDLTAKTKWVDDSVCSVSSANGGTLQFARFRALRDSVGTYILEYNVHIIGATIATDQTLTFGLGGATFPNFEAGTQAVIQEGRAYTRVGLPDVRQTTTVANPNIAVSGRAQLSGKPSWFDANAENAQSIDAYVEPDLTQAKSLGADVTAISDFLEFNNLTVGKRYRFAGNIYLISAATTNYCFIREGTTDVKIIQLQVSADTDRVSTSFEHTFTATETTVKLRKGVATGTVGATSNGVNATWAELTELANNQETTKFT